MGDVVELSSWRPKKPTIEELAVKSTELILADWERFAKINRLNDYFKNSLSSIAKDESYLTDLNALAVMELKMGIWPVVYFPNTTNPRQHGWVVTFELGKVKISTPEMATETYARAFAILLFLKVKHDALAAGLLY
jgi:hypothetical protein